MVCFSFRTPHHQENEQFNAASNPATPTLENGGVRPCLAPSVFNAGEKGVKQMEIFPMY